MDEGFINDEVDYSVEDDSYTDDQLPTNYERVSAQVQQETPSSWGDDIPDTVKAMPAPTIVTGTPRVSGAAQKETRAEQSTTKPNEAARVARTRTTEEILKCGRCGTNAHGQGRGCPWLEEVLRSGALTRVGTDDNYDLIRLDLAEPLSLNRYISNHKGAPIKSTKEAFELSCRSYSMNSVKAIPKWYRFEGQIPSLLGRMRTTIDSRAGVPLRVNENTRIERAAPFYGGVGPSSVPRLMTGRAPARPLAERITPAGSGRWRDDRLDRHEHRPVTVTQEVMRGPTPVFITSKTEDNFILTDSTGKDYLLNRGSIAAWTRQGPL